MRTQMSESVGPDMRQSLRNQLPRTQSVKWLMFKNSQFTASEKALGFGQLDETSATYSTSTETASMYHRSPVVERTMDGWNSSTYRPTTERVVDVCIMQGPKTGRTQTSKGEEEPLLP